MANVRTTRAYLSRAWPVLLSRVSGNAGAFPPNPDVERFKQQQAAASAPRAVIDVVPEPEPDPIEAPHANSAWPPTAPSTPEPVMKAVIERVVVKSVGT